MKGIIFNVVEEVATNVWDADTWDLILEKAEANGAYTALGNYHDAELGGIVGAASEVSGIPIPDLLRIVGRAGLPHLAKRLPGCTDGVPDAKTFMLGVNDIIHPEVKMLYADAMPPVFEFEADGDELLVRYRSQRGLYDLAAGLIEGCGELFNEEVKAVHLGPDDGGELFRVTFLGQSESA